MRAAADALMSFMNTTTRAMAQTPTPTGLYWNERGHVGCAGHTPYEGTDTWIWERWEPVPAGVLDHQRGRALRCETCGRAAASQP